MMPALVLVQLVLIAGRPPINELLHARISRPGRPAIRWSAFRAGWGGARAPAPAEPAAPLIDGKALGKLLFDLEGRKVLMSEPLGAEFNASATGGPFAPSARAAAVAAQRLPPSQVLELHANGSQRQMRTDYASILQQLQLSVRDLRMLRSHAAEIVVHESRIVYDLGELKGCIFRDRVVLLEAQREAARSLHRSLLLHLHQLNGRAASTTTSTFALSVFEVVLEETTAGFEHSFLRLETAIRSVLPTLTDPSAKEGGRMTALSRMLPLENALSSLRLRVRRVNAILEQLLESTDDIEGLCELSNGQPRRVGGNGAVGGVGGVGGTESSGRGAGGPSCTEADFALTEIAIEAYSSRLEFLADQIDSLTDFIGTARNSLEIALDSERNRMARLELYASMLSLPLAGIGAVAGIFGMNLRSGFEEAAHMFALVTGITVVIAMAAFSVCWVRYHEHNLSQGRQVLDAQAMKRALDLVDTVHHLARRQGAYAPGAADGSGSPGNGSLRRVRGLKQLLAQNGITVASQRDLEFLQAMFDDRTDGGGNVALA